MATVHVTLGYSKARTIGGAQLPVFLSAEQGADTVTTSSTSAVVNITVTQAHIDNGAIWRVAPMDGNVFVKAGTGTPVAAADTGWAVAAGATLEIAATDVGEKIALKDIA